MFGKQWCAMHIFVLLKLDNFINGIVHIYIVFQKKLRALSLYLTYNLLQIIIIFAELMYLSLIKLISKYGKRVAPIFT